MINQNTYLYLFIFVMITACGPKEESIILTPNTGNNMVTSTKRIIASPNFDFKFDHTISLQVIDFPSAYGKLNIYSHYQFYDESLKTYYPDYATQIASFIASTELSYPIIVKDNWTYLLLEWLPMDGKSNETYRKLILNDEDNYTFSFKFSG